MQADVEGAIRYAVVGAEDVKKSVLMGDWLGVVVVALMTGRLAQLPVWRPGQQATGSVR